MGLPTPPAEVPVDGNLNDLAPLFEVPVIILINSIDGDLPFETLRTEQRQAFLYGFGRTYDDGRGIVTNAETALNSWHGFGLAVDIVAKDKNHWSAPPTFWNRIGEKAEALGLVWGGRWHQADLPHVQWGKCPVSPTSADRALFAAQGMRAVWAKYGAI